MFQYYLRAAGIAMSWVGSGRFLFSHDFTEADFAEFMERFVAAAETMVADGWWWTAPHLTDKWIKKRVLRETLAALMGRRPAAGAGEAVEAPAPAPQAPAAASVEIPRPQPARDAAVAG
jgi:glutamate-1-semialdehyde 2,1-aminomutase